ncbi:AbiH family protein [Leuconostoc mesenteroides]|uniref:AbiH family protein n=1 Tax=Leuconostoc mesenteroides TaxID=1245 RepID=UPI00338F4F5D
MSNLFIIGNGFDLKPTNSLPTQYSDFKSFMLSNDMILPSYMINWDNISYETPDGGREVISENANQLIATLISNSDCSPNHDWSDLEDTLGYLDFDSLDLDATVLDKEGTEIPGLTDENYNQYFSIIYDAFSSFHEVFESWISSITTDLVVPIPSIQNIIDKNDIFINFNYTPTLEKKYNVDAKKILHIHGVQGKNNLLFGHKHTDNMSEDDIRYYALSDGINNINNLLLKNTNIGLCRLDNFLSTTTDLNEITDVYSIGFSYGLVDRDYIKKILADLSPTQQITWHFDDYDQKEHQQVFECYLRKLKFSGFFSWDHF